ncbi:MAG: endonuclease/exonuclease/phosphatase family protein [Saprospiraceae bacterium]|nr:endonuclease/exonuclease/phosphatase family protein [Saprospiraceae bacterium]
MNIFKCILPLILLILIVPKGTSQTKIMSYNIRYDTPNDGENWWDLRKDDVVELLKYYRADFVGIQEAMPNQFMYIADKIDDYKHIGFGRDGEGTNSEAIPIFYNSDYYVLLRSNTFWLSETPEKISKGWDAALNRIVLHGVFKNKKSNQIIHIINTHFDHKGKVARHKSAELLVEYIRNNHLANDNIVLMGDLNSLPTESPITLLEKELTNSYKTKESIAYGPIGTFNGFDILNPASRQIDYIFTKNIEINNYRCVDDRRHNNLFPSDHFPVLVDISINN